MKILARDDRRRPMDADDLSVLAQITDDSDWSTAQTAVRMIGERGYDRGRDLDTALERLRTKGPFV